MLIKPRTLLAGTACVLILVACNADEQKNGATSAKNSVAATVNGTSISESRVDILTRQLAAQGQGVGADSRKEIINHLAMQLITSQEAVKKGLDKTPEVQERLDLARQSILATALIQDYLKNNPVSDSMLQSEYDRIKTQMSGNEYKARHILVEKEAEAKDIIAKLKKNPKAFVALAKEKSKDTGSKDKGGDLGWFDPRGMVPEFGAAVVKLEKGKFTQEPVKSQFGYHVILLEDSRPKQIPPLDQVKPALQQQVQQQNVKKMLDGLKASAKIEIVEAPAPVSPPKAEDKTATDTKK